MGQARKSEKQEGEGREAQSSCEQCPAGSEGKRLGPGKGKAVARRAAASRGRSAVCGPH